MPTSNPSDPNHPRLVIIGGGGHALVVAEAAALAGFTITGFLDDNPAAALASGSPSATCLGRLADAAPILMKLPPGTAWIVALGQTPPSPLRLRILAGLIQLTSSAATVVHPTAFVSPSATIGRGVFIGPHAVLHARARVRDHAIINTAAVIEHDCLVGDNAHVAPGAVLGGGARIGNDSLIGLGARVLPRIAVGPRCTVGAGAVVTTDVPDGRKVAGVPASLLSD